MIQNKRHSIRLPQYDYSQGGPYFVTICVEGRMDRLGVVLGGEMKLNKLGEIANDGWRWLEKKFPGFGIPVFCVMPNHAHAVITIEYKSKTRRGGVTPPNQGEGEVTSPLRQPTLDK